MKACVDYLDLKPFLRQGVCAEDVAQAVCVLQMAYDEGQWRKKLIKKHQVQKFTQLPASEGMRPLMISVDEATSLVQVDDARGAAVHVTCWRQPFAGLCPRSSWSAGSRTDSLYNPANLPRVPSN